MITRYKQLFTHLFFSYNQKYSLTVASFYLLDDRMRYDIEYFGDGYINDVYTHVYHHLKFILAFEKVLPRRPLSIAIFQQNVMKEEEARKLSFKLNLFNKKLFHKVKFVVEKCPDCIVVKLPFQQHFNFINKLAKHEPIEYENYKCKL